MDDLQRTFFCGVVEGFYGRPWTPAQRRELFLWMQPWGLTTYVYAPKDDLKHRALWRELYDDGERRELRALIAASRRRRLNFVYAIAPGLDLRYSAPGDLAALKAKIGQVIALGCRQFAILFDDIPQRMVASDARRFGSIAAAQSRLTHELLGFIRARVQPARLMFCPTPYCGRMAKPSVAECAYLLEIGERLDPRIDVFWTGPEIVSQTIPLGSLLEVQRVLRRPPVLWDNLFANDYDLRRIYLGPYSGRPLRMREHVRGIVANPNSDFDLNFVPLRTLSLFARGRRTWQPRAAYRQALAEWRPALRTRCGAGVTRADLELLGDLFYLPFRSGERAGQMLHDLQCSLERSSNRQRAASRRFERACRAILGLFDTLTRVEDRALAGALFRHLWELKEEIALSRAFVAWFQAGPRRGRRFFSEDFRPRVFRGGFVAALQQMLPMDEDGGFGYRRTFP